jgi:hypothetical protein
LQALGEINDIAAGSVVEEFIGTHIADDGCACGDADAKRYVSGRI